VRDIELPPAVIALIIVVGGFVIGGILIGLGVTFIGILIAVAAIPFALVAWLAAS
jgi:hypothetical protein